MKSLEKAASWYFSKQALPYWSILILDCVLILLSDFLIYTVGHGAIFTLQHFSGLLGTFAFYLIFFVIGFRLFHTYSGVLRFSSFIDLQRIGMAILTGCVLSIMFGKFFDPSWLVDIRVSETLISSLVALLLICWVRVWVKTVYESTVKKGRNIPVFIYGVKEGGVALAKNINNSEESPYEIEGFISDKSDMAGKRLMGEPRFS